MFNTVVNICIIQILRNTPGQSKSLTVQIISFFSRILAPGHLNIAV